MQSANASPDEAAAIAAALERFLWETAPAPRPAEVSRWQRAALLEGVSSRSGLGSGWGIASGLEPGLCLGRKCNRTHAANPIALT